MHHASNFCSARPSHVQKAKSSKQHNSRLPKTPPRRFLRSRETKPCCKVEKVGFSKEPLCHGRRPSPTGPRQRPHSAQPDLRAPRSTAAKQQFPLGSCPIYPRVIMELVHPVTGGRCTPQTVTDPRRRVHCWLRRVWWKRVLDHILDTDIAMPHCIKHASHAARAAPAPR